jgi:hypothetical protein
MLEEDDDDDFGANGGVNDWQGKPKYSEKTCPTVALANIDSTWLDPGSNPGRRGGKPVTDRLSYSTE